MEEESVEDELGMQAFDCKFCGKTQDVGVDDLDVQPFCSPECKEKFEKLEREQFGKAIEALKDDLIILDGDNQMVKDALIIVPEDKYGILVRGKGSVISDCVFASMDDIRRLYEKASIEQLRCMIRMLNLEISNKQIKNSVTTVETFIECVECGHKFLSPLAVNGAKTIVEACEILNQFKLVPCPCTCPECQKSTPISREQIIFRECITYKKLKIRKRESEER